jgi:glycosyltransferase involved in cell wall biosynthesis
LFSFPDSVYDITNTQEYKAADIIHLHWVSNFLDYPSFFLKNEKPVVWTPHDMNPFTGGCHSSLDCNGYQNSCRDCPQLSSLSRADEARNILSGKRGALLARKAPLAIASLSGWMHECSQKSSIFRDLPNYVIPNSINTAVFKPQNQLMARQIMNLPADKKILFFLSDDIQNKLKGFHLLLECLSYLKNIENVILVSVGRATGSLGNVSIPHMHLGYISDEEQLSAVYNSADLLINPSLAESFSLVTLEAMACGIPVAAFRTGGILNLVREGKTGLLAATGDAGQLAEKVAWLLQNEKSRKEMGILASQIAADQYTRDRQVVNYLKIYESLYQQF